MIISNSAVTISGREITKSELDAIYDEFKRRDIQNGISVIPQVRYQYLAEENGNIIGFASGQTNHKWFYLSDMWATAKYRRQGLGTKLLRILEEKVCAVCVDKVPW
jgi:GNAT superfamily N-acetyltransferase